jgi:hypothetical protein
MTGPEGTWHVATTGAQGYVVDQLEWQAPPSRYVASASLWGPFRAQFVPPPSGERLEVRVWSPGSTAVNVYRAGLRPAPAAAP